MKLQNQSIGRYHIIEPLGEGGMAVVYKAYDTHLECEVAVKVIRVDNLPRNAEERALKRFEREAKAVARLTHPNIVKVTDYGEEDGKPYLVMPYLPGGTLKELIKERGQIPWQEAARILIPIAEALAYAHSQGVIHRDIKPSNILLTQSGQPMLTDFGVAKIIEDEATQDLTGTSATVGTPEYMAPEQITSKTVDARADLYSLGVVFYEMITGRKPFEADTPMAVLFKHASDPLPRPSQYVNNLPDIAEQFLYKSLSKKPTERFQTADEVSKVLTIISQYTGKNINKNVYNFPTLVKSNKPKATVRYLVIAVFLVLFVTTGIVLVTLLNKIKVIDNLVSSPSVTISQNENNSISQSTLSESKEPLALTPTEQSTQTYTITPDINQTLSVLLTSSAETEVKNTETKTPTIMIPVTVKTPTPGSTLRIFSVTINNTQSYQIDLYLNHKFIVKINAYDKTIQSLPEGNWMFSCCKSGTECKISESWGVFSNRYINCPLE